jgi:NADH-quinone oxidoreductase subunit J
VSPGAGEQVAFWVLSVLAVVGALGMVGSRRAVHSALWLASTMISLAVLYIMQGAVFLGVVQIVVYTGAVMMLFLFVLMLVGVDASDSLVETLRGQRFAAIAVGVGFGVLLMAALSRATLDTAVGVEAANTAAGGNVEGLAQLMFSRYVWVFEVTSALLITAAVAAMVLTHRERIDRRHTQREQSQARFLSDVLPGAPLASPGVYARHNAVDTPALLPDGAVADISVPAPLGARGDVRDVAPEQLSAGAGASIEVIQATVPTGRADGRGEQRPEGEV